MESLVKKYFWVVNLLVLAVIAWLAARVVNNWVAGQIAALETHPKAPERDKKGKGADEEGGPMHWSAVSDRNLFNSTPPVEDPNAGVAEEGEKVPEFDPKAIPCPTCECEESEAKLGLLATMVAEPSVWSMAIIDDSESRESRLVKEEQEVADHIVKAIQRDRVVLASKSSGKVGCVELGKKAAGAKRYAPPRSAAGSATSGTRSDVKEGVKKVGANAYEIDRGMLNEQLEDLSALSRQARVIPHYRGGKPQGFKIVGVRPGSLYSHIGLRSGDVIKGVNDEEITTPNKALELYEKLKNSDNVSVDIERRGRKTKLEYTIK